MTTGEVRSYPFYFTYQDIVMGEGFLAEVCTRGRARIIKEDDGWWMYGVEPGGLAEGGKTIQEAHMRFRQTFREILFDIASSVEEFSEFSHETERFIREVNQPENEDWWKAVEEVRSKGLIPDPDVEGYRREQAETDVRVTVKDITCRRDLYSSEQNQTEEYFSAA
jgi:hypothetical protein